MYIQFTSCVYWVVSSIILTSLKESVFLPPLPPAPLTPNPKRAPKNPTQIKAKQSLLSVFSDIY